MTYFFILFIFLHFLIYIYALILHINAFNHKYFKIYFLHQISRYFIDVFSYNINILSIAMHHVVTPMPRTHIFFKKAKNNDFRFFLSFLMVYISTDMMQYCFRSMGFDSCNVYVPTLGPRHRGHYVVCGYT